MGVDVQIEDEDGNMIEHMGDIKGQFSNFIPSLIESNSFCLRFIDLYGNTIFNQMQIPILIEEISEALEHVENKDNYEFINEILLFIRKAKGQVHTYVRFIGD
jgi:hypothetical protein